MHCNTQDTTHPRKHLTGRGRAAASGVSRAAWHAASLRGCRRRVGRARAPCGCAASPDHSQRKCALRARGRLPLVRSPRRPSAWLCCLRPCSRAASGAPWPVRPAWRAWRRRASAFRQSCAPRAAWALLQTGWRGQPLLIRIEAVLCYCSCLMSKSERHLALHTAHACPQVARSSAMLVVAVRCASSKSPSESSASELSLLDDRPSAEAASSLCTPSSECLQCKMQSSQYREWHAPIIRGSAVPRHVCDACKLEPSGLAL